MGDEMAPRLIGNQQMFRAAFPVVNAEVFYQLGALFRGEGLKIDQTAGAVKYTLSHYHITVYVRQVAEQVTIVHVLGQPMDAEDRQQAEALTLMLFDAIHAIVRMYGG